MTLTPPLVERAEQTAREHGFTKSCSHETGRLLHVLAARRGIARAGEIGTGYGVGAAWIVSALVPGVPFVTVESDAVAAAAAGALFDEDVAVTVHTGDWRGVMPAEAPFDLLFVDVSEAKDDPATVLGLVTPGGTIVLDDFSADWPTPDQRRERWLQHPRVAGLMVGLGGESLALLATVTR